MALTIRSRASWDAERPHNTPTKVSWVRKTIFVHHTAVPFTSSAKTGAGIVREEKAHMRKLQQIAFGRGFSDISYNYVVFPSGRVYAGRGARIKGAHTQGGKPGYAEFYNDHPGVAFPGDYGTKKLTGAQLESFRLLRRRLRNRYLVSGRRWPHCRVYPTACPGKNVLAQLGLSV